MNRAKEVTMINTSNFAYEMEDKLMLIVWSVFILIYGIYHIIIIMIDMISVAFGATATICAYPFLRSAYRIVPYLSK